MKIKSFVNNVLIPVLLATVLATGCSKSTNADEQALTQTTSVEIFSYLMTEVFTLGLDAFYKEGPETSENISDLHIFVSTDPQTVSETVPCDQGGAISVTGSYINTFTDQGTGDFAMEIRQKPNNCAIQTSQGTFTVNGNPDLYFQGDIHVENWEFVGTYTFSIKGGYNWSGPGSSGSCSVDMTYLYNWQSQQVSMSGSMCGYSFS